MSLSPVREVHHLSFRGQKDCEMNASAQLAKQRLFRCQRLSFAQEPRDGVTLQIRHMIRRKWGVCAGLTSQNTQRSV